METLRTRLQELTVDAVGLLSGIGDARSLAMASEGDVLGLLGEVEGLVRVADALAILVAGEAGQRSRPALGTEGLAHRFGAGNAVELLERACRIDRATARRRLKLADRLQPGMSLLGELCPADFPTVRAGLLTGALGVDSATVITTELQKARVGVPMDLLGNVHTAERELVCAAIGISPEPGVPALPPVLPAETLFQAQVWLDGILNPDGVEPSFTEFQQRGITTGRPLPGGGLVPVKGLLLPEVAGKLQRLFDALTNPRQTGRFLTPEQQAEADELGVRDPRSRAQRQHDALATILDVAGRCTDLPTLGGASPTMIVTTTTDDYDNGSPDGNGGGVGSTGRYAGASGVGHVDGLDTPIPMVAVRQLCCTNGVQRIDLHPNGKIHRLGTTERCFTRQQRRALTVRDGGCIIPGCPIPAWACEAHHVLAYENGGATHVDNGVLLCWFHHRTIETSGWHIRMTHGAPEVKPPPWLGTPDWRPASTSPTRATTTLRTRLRN